MRDLSSVGTGELVREVADDVRLLVRKELQLARVELTETVVSKLTGAGLVAGAAIGAVPGLVFLLVALALWLPPSDESGFAIVGAGMLVVAAATVAVGVRLVKRPAKGVEESLESVKEDVRWARRRLRP